MLNKKYWRDFVDTNRMMNPERFKELESRNTLLIKPANEISLREARRVMRYYGTEAREFNTNGKFKFGHLVLKLEYYWLSVIFIMRNGTFRYFCVLILFSVAGFLISPAFYSFHLLDVIGRFSTLQDVIKSVTLNFSDLLTTALLGVILIYIFSAIGFIFLYDMFYNEEVERDIGAKRGESICHNLLN